MRVNVSHLVVCHASALESRGDATPEAFALRGRGGDVVGVTARAIAHEFAVDVSASSDRVVQCFQNNYTGSLTHDKATPVSRKASVFTRDFHIRKRGSRLEIERELGVQTQRSTVQGMVATERGVGGGPYHLCLSKGRLPLVGSSLNCVHMAFIEQKPAKEVGVMAASVPPASMTSA